MAVDAHEVLALAINLAEAPDRVQHAAADLFANEADALQREMRRGAENHRYLPDTTKSGQANFARNLTQQKLAPMDHAVGFANKRAASIAHIIAFGSVNNDPVYDFYGPLRRRAPEFVRHLARIAEDESYRHTGRA